MVQTRKGTVVDAAATIAYQKTLASKRNAQHKKHHAPVSKLKRKSQKKQATSLSRVSKRSGRMQKVSAKAKSFKKGEPIEVTNTRTKVHFKATAKSPLSKSTATTVLQKDRTVQASKKRKITEYLERETDAEMTSMVVIKFRDYRGPAFRPRRVNYKKPYPPKFFSNIKRFKVGHQPFTSWRGPGTKPYYGVFYALQDQYGPQANEDDRIQLNLSKEPLLPGHAYTGKGHRFHALIEPILSCATSNNNQKLAADSLKRKLTYRNGQMSTTDPNYHRLIEMSEKELADILKPGGRHNDNAERIIALFHSIREENIQRRGISSEEAARIHEKAKNADAWTDGLLSLDFMVGMGMQEMFDKIVTYKGIGCKTAACIMCFTFGFAVFAVDTHVFRLCQWLGWLPRNCDREDAFKFLTVAIPPELHRDLHQGQWHHGQLCFRCNQDTYDKVDDPRWKATVCPLEQFSIVRFPEWEKQKATGPSSPRTKEVKKENEMTTVQLKSDKQVAHALAAGHEVFETAIDDAFSADPERSNIKKELKRYLYITKAQERAFKEFQKKASASPKTGQVKTKVVKKMRMTIKEDVEITTTTTTTITEGDEDQEEEVEDDGDNNDKVDADDDV